ncbi:hypothetical protein [Cohnella thailandensis]|uniref:Uncharacterized protein n=1 Tax=Cohnella thailandensis TaxID=557557 RepID=A0A841T7S9_9BACL|nr:hypothetical protein [Cohnella thailandensis]MBB6637231.1 hypothetical protein [Cohnella thailandensis]MBP1976947.1 hypothetical protein [Cohnella thailandensis]
MPIRAKKKTMNKRGEGPIPGKGVLPFAIRSLYRVVIRFSDVDTLLVAICMDLLLNVHSDEESLRYFPDLTDEETSEQIILKQGLTVFIATSCTVEQLRERFTPFHYVAGVDILPLDQLGPR